MSARKRGQSEVVGVVLLLGIAMAGIALVVAIGGAALDQSQSGLGVQRAEKSLTQLDSKAAMVALGYSRSQTIPLGSQQGGQYEVDNEGAWMRVTIENVSTGNTETLLNVTLGEVRYTNGDATVAYQGGGVWKKQQGENGSTMVSPPEFHYRNASLTLPVISVSSEGSLSGTATVEKNGTTNKTFPNATLDKNFTNPLEGQKVNITVDSKYYQSWGEYFEERTTGNVSINHDKQRVTIKLLQQDGTRKVREGLAVTGGSGTLDIQSGNNAAIDSYNSSTYNPNAGPSSPPSSFGSGADVKVGMDVVLNSGNPHIKGNLTTAGSVSMTGAGSQFDVDGYVKYAEGSHDASECTDHVENDGGWCNDNASVDLTKPIDGEVESTLSDLENNNDNSGEPCFTEGDAVDWSTCGNQITIESGDYYATNGFKVDGNNKKLILDTTNGDIRIGVDDGSDVKLTAGNLTIVGDGTVEIYSKDNSIDIKNGKFWNRGWDANQLWIYGSKDSQVTISNNPDFVGVVYAPSESGVGNSGLTITGGQTDVYGAVVGGSGGSTVTLDNNADIHYDNSIQNQQVFSGPTVPAISYLHVSVNRINVTSS